MRRLLIVIDMQNDFIDGALGTPEALAIMEKVKDKIRSYPPQDVIATMDTHGEDYMSSQEGQNLPVPHCIRGTDGWQLRPEIGELLQDAAIYDKPTFGSVRLAEDLKALSEMKELELELVPGILVLECLQPVQPLRFQQEQLAFPKLRVQR